MYNRQELSEVCFWALNNLLLIDSSKTGFVAQLLIEGGISEAINLVFEKILKKKKEMLSELLWLISYVSSSSG